MAAPRRIRIGVAWDKDTSAAHYRAFDPARALERRGHTVIWPRDPAGEIDVDRLMGCDVMLVYRRFDDESQAALQELIDAGIPLVRDNDDDLAHLPRESPRYAVLGGTKGQVLFRKAVWAARTATIATVPTVPLATRYRESGVPNVCVIPNAVSPGFRPRRSHRGTIIGWIAGREHLAELARLPIVESLAWIQKRHAEVHVEAIGVDLGLVERYRHDSFVPFGQLPERMARFDLGLAPLADLTFNASRSDIKVKEYAASGVAWLASDRTPYGLYGRDQGGDLVADDRWPEKLDRLIRDHGARRALAKAGRAWSQRQTINATVRLWEQVLLAAVRRDPTSRVGDLDVS